MSLAISPSFWKVEFSSLLIFSWAWSDSDSNFEIFSGKEGTVIEKGNSFGSSLARESSCFLSTMKVWRQAE